jgi:hypothetical protein
MICALSDGAPDDKLLALAACGPEDGVSLTS